MGKVKKIHNLVTLEREIYRLELKAKNIEEKMNRNFDHLHDNYLSMFLNSFFPKRKSCKEGVLIRLLKRLWT